MQRRGRGVTDVSMTGSAHFCSRIYRDHVHRVILVQPRRRSYSVTSDKGRNVRIMQQTSTQPIFEQVRDLNYYRGERLYFVEGFSM